MTSLTLFSLALVSLAAAIPAAQPLNKDEAEVVSAADDADPPTCQPGRTICIDMFNGCGIKTGGCYDACQLMTYTFPPCSSSASWTIPAATSADAVARLKAGPGIFAEMLNVGIPSAQTSSVVATALSQPTSHLDGLSMDSDVATVFPAPGFAPSSQSGEFIQPLPLPTGYAESSPAVAAPSVTTAPQLAVVKAALYKSDNTGAVAATQSTGKVCGKKTKCYDYVTSMNTDCPAVRYGGCIDTCKDPKTAFKPQCRVARRAGRWLG